jgi:hypothetical protein
MALAEKIHEGLRRHSEKEKAKASKKNAEKEKVHHFEVHPAEGGHLVQVHMQKKMGDGYMTHEHHKDKDSIHKTMKSAAKHMGGMCSCGNCNEADSGVAVGAGENGGGADED